MLSLLLRLHNWGRLWGCQSRNRTCPHRLTVLHIVLTGEGWGRENSVLSELVPATAQGWGRIPVCPVVVRLGEMLHQWRAQLLLEKRSCASPWGRSRQGPRSGDSRPSTKVGSFLVGFFFLVSGGGLLLQCSGAYRAGAAPRGGIGLVSDGCCCSLAGLVGAVVLSGVEATGW